MDRTPLRGFPPSTSLVDAVNKSCPENSASFGALIRSDQRRTTCAPQQHEPGVEMETAISTTPTITAKTLSRMTPLRSGRTAIERYAQPPNS